MFTLGMNNGDLEINERGQPSTLKGKDKLIQDISEALNSGFNANKNFGGKLYDMEVNTTNDVLSEVYNILERLMATQTNADDAERIKTINSVNAIKNQSNIYVYISVSSYAKETVSNTYTII